MGQEKGGEGEKEDSKKKFNVEYADRTHDLQIFMAEFTSVY